VNPDRPIRLDRDHPLDRADEPLKFLEAGGRERYREEHTCRRSEFGPRHRGSELEPEGEAGSSMTGDAFAPDLGAQGHADRNDGVVNGTEVEDGNEPPAQSSIRAYTQAMAQSARGESFGNVPVCRRWDFGSSFSPDPATGPSCAPSATGRPRSRLRDSLGTMGSCSESFQILRRNRRGEFRRRRSLPKGSLRRLGELFRRWAPLK
jgi:hypothetical protein